MLNRWFGPKAHDFLHVLGMCVLAAGLPFNKVLMSIGAIWGVSNLVLEGQYTLYLKKLKENKTALLFIGLFAIGIVGLLWSENLGYGLDDLRKKLPILALPLALAAKPLAKKEIWMVLGVFVGSVLLFSIYNFTTYFFFNLGEELSNVRSMSKYVSHIRFSMMIVAAALISTTFAIQFKRFWLPLSLVVLWFLAYTYLSQVLTGILALIGILYGLIVYFSWERTFLRAFLLLLPFLLFTIGFQLLTNQGKSQMSPPYPLMEKTAEGNTYRHDTLNKMVENGQFVNIYICDEELEREWSMVSKYPYDGFDDQGQLITGTLYRYMTHLGLKKDAKGFKQLNNEAFRNIEKGYANPNGAKSGIQGRLADLKFQLENNAEPNGHSLLQRLEYWKTAGHILESHFLLGVGTGDVADAFQQQYEKDDSPLIDRYRLRAHNTYLTHWVSYGVVGLLLTLIFFYSFLAKMHAHKQYLGFLLLYIFLFSFLIEDTLETQAGVSLFGFLLSLYLAEKSETTETTIS